MSAALTITSALITTIGGPSIITIIARKGTDARPAEAVHTCS